MKKIVLIIMLIIPLVTKAQFVIGTEGITVKSGAMITIDSLVLQPSSDLTIASNQLQRSASSIAINAGSSIGRVYAFTTAVNFTGTAGFFYRDAELAGNTESGLQMAYSATNAGAVWITTSGSLVNTSTNFISNTFSNAPLSRITASSSLTPLPVTILEFQATKNEAERTALLSWDVANEMNIGAYIVERSTDGTSFAGIGTVSASGNTEYSLTDHQPENGLNYYRLQIMEQSGSFKYSAIRQLHFGARTSEIKVYPNPVVAEVTIHTTDATLAGTAGIVIDITGKMISNFKLNGQSVTLNASSWPAGTYLLKLASGQVFKVEKL